MAAAHVPAVSRGEGREAFGRVLCMKMRACQPCAIGEGVDCGVGWLRPPVVHP
jgi:hypothetical protein